jgi:hypothetical protein
MDATVVVPAGADDKPNRFPAPRVRAVPAVRTEKFDPVIVPATSTLVPKIMGL